MSSQQNEELAKRKSEIAERINQVNLHNDGCVSKFKKNIASLFFLKIEMLDSFLKEEKSVIELKRAHLEANLRAKTKQLQERTEEVENFNNLKFIFLILKKIFKKIKELNKTISSLNEEKEQSLYKLQQFENLLKCQRLEIESKTSLIKQIELVSTFIT